MAKVISRKNKLNKKIIGLKLHRIMLLIISFICLVLSIYFLLMNNKINNFIINIILVDGFAILSFVFFKLFLNRKNKITTMKAGLTGEKNALKVFEALPKDYIIVTDLEIEYEKNKSQLDCVIIAPNGVFACELKTLKGELYVDQDSKNLMLMKTGRAGGKYSKKMYNPVRQVGTHVYRLSKVLKEQGYKTFVQGMVMFMGDECDLRYTKGKVPIFNEKDGGVKKMTSYIRNYNKQGRLLTSTEMYKISLFLSDFT